MGSRQFSDGGQSHRYQQQQHAGGGSLQNYNNDLVGCLQEVRQRRELVHKEITHQESEKSRIEKELQVMQEQVRRLHDSIECKKQSRNDYDKTIGETEAAYMKILESSQTLLHVLKRETQNLIKNPNGRA